MLTSEPDFSAEPIRTIVLDLFAKHGAQGQVRYAIGGGPDEAVFVLTTQGAANVNEMALTQELTALLRRKVWVTTYSDIWAGRTAILG